jgi:hypothetical protein
MELTAKTDKATQMNACLNNTSNNYIRLSPGERGCIQIEVPSLPLTEWYTIDVKIISPSTGVAVTFRLNERFINTDGSFKTVTVEDEVENGGCDPKYDTTMWTENGEFYIGGTLLTGG